MMTPGAKLGGRYRLDERIATGGMGEVWRTHDEVLGREVAVKVLLPSLLNEPGFIERFRGEARVVATLTHPNVVRVYDYGESPLPGGGQVAYLVMEFVHGESLTKRLQRMGRLTSAQALPLLAQAAEALHAAHQAGVIHRDVKPGNLLIDPDDKVMLTDFGIARSAVTGGLTQAGSVLGTAAYVSPEQASGHEVTARSDLYSLGIVAYQCLAGRRPFDSDNPLELAMRHVNEEPAPLPEDVEPAARGFTARLLAKDPAQRYADGTEAAAAARAAVDSPQTAQLAAAPPAADPGFAAGAAAPPPGRGLDPDSGEHGEARLGTGPMDRRRGKLVLALAGGFLAVVLAGAGVWTLVNSGGDEEEPGGQTGQEPSSDSEENGDGVEIVAADYLDQTPEEAKADLEAKGFENVVFDGAGRYVVDVSPEGEQPLDAEITVTRGPQPVQEDPGGESPGGEESCEPTGEIGGCIGNRVP